MNHFTAILLSTLYLTAAAADLRPTVDAIPYFTQSDLPSDAPSVLGTPPEDVELLPPFTRYDLDLLDSEPGLRKIGRSFDVDLAPALRGDWVELDSGDHVWLLAVNSSTADWLRVAFNPFNLPAGAQMVLYNALDPEEVYGPYTTGIGAQGTWWAPTIHSQEIRVELHIPAGIEPREASEALEISSVMQGFLPEPEADALACRLDVTCDSAWDFDAQGVAHIQFVRGGVGYMCSGGMLNRIGEDFAPLFLTAAHCISSEAEANSIEVYWLFQTSSCNGSPPPLSSVPRTNGSTLLASWNTTDVSLLGLTGDVHSPLTYLGWDANDIPNGEAGTLIHHPAGVRKSISYGVYEGRHDNQCDLGDWTYRLDLSDGGQEGGSSGAPGFDAAHRVRTVASCSESGCSPGENTWEGSFPDTWDRLEPFLWGENDVWVNGAWGGTEKGTAAEPFNELIEGYFGVLDGGTIHMAAGNYPAITLDGTRSVVIVAEGGTVQVGD